MHKTECSRKVVGYKIRTENGEFMSLDINGMWPTSEGIYQTVYTLNQLRNIVFKLGWFDKDTETLVAVWGDK